MANSQISWTIRRASIALVAVAFFCLPLTRSALAAADKELAAVKGSVSYQAPGASAVPVVGTQIVADNGSAITGANSAANLTLPDSSVVSLGSNTNIVVGAFTTGVQGPGSTILVNNGAVKFDIKHPSGGRANYSFQTPTSQIAVRGTVGILTVNATQTQVACVSCAKGDVTVTVGAQTFAVVTGEVLTIIGSSAASATAAVAPLSSVANAPAMGQFGGTISSSAGGAAGGAASSAAVTSSSAAVSSAAAASSSVVAAAAAGTAAVAGGVSAATAKSAPAAPSPPPATLGVSSTTLSIVGVGATASFSVTGAVGNLSASSSNAAVARVSGPTGLSFTVTGVGAGTAVISVVTDAGQSAVVNATVTQTNVTPQRKITSPVMPSAPAAPTPAAATPGGRRI